MPRLLDTPLEPLRPFLGDLDDDEGFEEVPIERDEDEEAMEVDGKAPKDPNGMLSLSSNKIYVLNSIS